MLLLQQETHNNSNFILWGDEGNWQPATDFQSFFSNRKIEKQTKKFSENFEIGELVRISNHTKVLKNGDYIFYNPPQGLRKSIIKER